MNLASCLSLGDSKMGSAQLGPSGVHSLIGESDKFQSDMMKPILEESTGC